MNMNGYDWRGRRNLLNQGLPLGPMHLTISNYSTDAKIPTELKARFGDEVLLNKLHSIPDPLKKNLGDTVITEKKKKTNEEMAPTDIQEFFYEANAGMNTTKKPKSDFYQSLTGITGFFTNVFGAISGAMFQRRAKSPVSQYYDCSDDTDGARERSPSFSWQGSKIDDQNKNERASEQFCTEPSNMNNCRSAVAQCEGKLNAVKNLLNNKTVPSPKCRSRRPRRVFVEPNSIEDRFEDAFAPEDFISVENEEYVEFFTVPNNQDQQLCEVDAPIVKSEIAPVQENSNIAVNIPEISVNIENTNTNVDRIENPEKVIVETIDRKIETKEEIISSCEDKMARLKSLLQEKRKKASKINHDLTESAPEPASEDKVPEQSKKHTKTVTIDKVQDKHFKNPYRLSADKRKKSKLKKNIQDDLLFASEIDSDDISSSIENSPVSIQRLSDYPSEESLEDSEYFDEVKGRFRSTSTTESEDSFQIVFTDSPQLSRKRRPSDCESEDSFIVFEESPDSCYTSNDVFGEETGRDISDSECSDSYSEVSDSGCPDEVCKISHSLSRTISDLTDDSLYEQAEKLDNDEVDCAVRTVCEVISPSEGSCEVVTEEPIKRGLLLSEERKRQKKSQPPKTVTFSPKPPKVHRMIVWAFAARQARTSHWERLLADRTRFGRRIFDVDMAISWVLKPQHRTRVMFQRFNPWWNAQKRQEIAEKKQKEEEEKLRIEAEEQARLDCKDTTTDISDKGEAESTGDNENGDVKAGISIKIEADSNLANNDKHLDVNDTHKNEKCGDKLIDSKVNSVGLNECILEN